jgi:hypothetical protein
LLSAGVGTALRPRDDDRGQRRRWLFGSAIVALVLAQTAAHLSLRSPYTYSTHFERPPSANYWHVAYLLPPPGAAVNADTVRYMEVEEHFRGAPRPTNTALLRRAFLYYLASQVTSAANAYWVYLVLNIGLWIGACACVHHLARSWFSPEVAAYATVLAATGTGFIMYVAQPAPNLAGYALVAILVWLFDRFPVGAQGAGWGRVLVLGGALGLGCLTYDLFALFPCLLGLACLKRSGPVRVLGALALAWAIYRGFFILQEAVLLLPPNPLNSRFLDSSARNIVDLVRDRRIEDVYVLTLQFLRYYAGDLAHAFFAVPLVLALAGAFFVWRRSTAVAVWLLATPSLLGVAFLTFGQTRWGNEDLAALPRFAYAAYPAVYLLAGVALAELRKALAALGWNRWGPLAVAVTLTGIAVLNNLDVLLGWARPYYLFYWTHGGYF